MYIINLIYITNLLFSNRYILLYNAFGNIRKSLIIKIKQVVIKYV